MKFSLRFSVIILLFVSYSLSLAQTEPDRDGDGVPDSVDRCISEPGPPSNNGCPVTPTAPVASTQPSAPNNPAPAPTNDDDGDGTLNDDDACPQAGGPDWNNGCPTDAQSPVELTPDAPVVPIPPVVIDPTAPCVMWSPNGVVNRRAYASLLAPIAGTIQPGELFPVNFMLITSDGAFYETFPWSWVFADAVQIGGNCDDLTIIELPEGDIVDEEVAGSASGQATGKRQHEPFTLILPPEEESSNALVMQFPTILMTLIMPPDDSAYRLLPIPLDPSVATIRFEVIEPPFNPPPSSDVPTIFHTLPDETSGNRITIYVPSDEENTDYIEMFINLPTPDPTDPDDDGSDPTPMMFNDWQVPDDTSSCLWVWTNNILLPWGAGEFFRVDLYDWNSTFYVMTEDGTATVSVHADLYEENAGTIMDTLEIRADGNLVADMPPSQFPVDAQFDLVGDKYTLLIATQPTPYINAQGEYTATCSSAS